MQELLILIRELADTLARCQAFRLEELKRISHPSDIIERADDPLFQPWLEFEPVNGLTYL